MPIFSVDLDTNIRIFFKDVLRYLKKFRGIFKYLGVLMVFHKIPYFLQLFTKNLVKTLKHGSLHENLLVLMVFHKIPYFFLKTSSEVQSIPLSSDSLVLKGILILCQLSSSAVSSLNNISQRCKPVVNKVTKAVDVLIYGYAIDVQHLSQQ